MLAWRCFLVFVAVMAVFSIVGLNHYEPRRPVMRFTSCWLGVNPVISFGSSRRFSVGHRVRGNDVRVRSYFVSWPGGAAALWLTPDCSFDPNPIATEKRP